MALEIIRASIFDVKADIMVNPTDYRLSGSGSIDYLVHKYGGNQMVEACKKYKTCSFGDVVITNAYGLNNAKFVFHTVGPFYDKKIDQEKLLISCYTRCLEEATKRKIKSISFPLIASGSFGYPTEEALVLAINTITRYLMLKDQFIDIKLVLYSKESYELAQRYFPHLMSISSGQEEKKVEHNYWMSIMSYEVFESARVERVRPSRDRGANELEMLKYYRSNNIELSIDSNVYCEQQTEEEIRKMYEDAGVIEFDSTTGELIKPYMKGIKVKDLLEATNIKKSTYYNVLDDYHESSKKNVFALCMALPLPHKVVLKILQNKNVKFNMNDKIERLIYQHLVTRVVTPKKLYSVQFFDYYLEDNHMPCYFYEKDY